MNPTTKPNPATQAAYDQAWHTWTGCCLSRISAHHPVLVRITAPIGVPPDAS